MAVALVHGGVGGEKVEVAAAFDVVDPGALGALDDDVQGVIVVGSVAIFEGDQVVRIGSRTVLGLHCGTLVSGLLQSCRRSARNG